MKIQLFATLLALAGFAQMAEAKVEIYTCKEVSTKFKMTLQLNRTKIYFDGKVFGEYSHKTDGDGRSMTVYAGETDYDIHFFDAEKGARDMIYVDNRYPDDSVEFTCKKTGAQG